jgi:hypothetical protein
MQDEKWFFLCFFSGKALSFNLPPTPMSNERLQTTWAKAEIAAVSTDQSQSSMHVGGLL